VIKEAKDLLEGIIKNLIPGVTVVKSTAEESRQIMVRNFPLVSLITNPGNFDDSEARTIRYHDEQDGGYKQRYVRGNRVLPVLVRCWAAGEDEADAVFSRIIPAVPSRWECGDFTGSVEIGAEEHSDHTGNVAKLYLSVAEVRFSAAAAMDAELVPVFETVEQEGGEFA
jgi:hypothetical protein